MRGNERLFHPWKLAWDEVDPGRHPFDPGGALDVVRGLAPAGRVPSGEVLQGRDGRRAGFDWANAMSAALVDRYGRWTIGWRWGHDESEFGGGPVASWCCPPHSVTTPDETLDRVARSLVEWRAFIEDVAERFARFPVRAAPPEDREWMWERAAVHLITRTIDCTGAGDAWYGTCEAVLGWFLAAAGVPAVEAAALVERAIGGRFGSWTAPEPAVVADVGERLAAGLADRDD
ncbi:hypothetical protein [Actinomadura algeriensis]|uniref:ADP-ribosylglycohydrolase n=1 Tax=Actinomadura algeriensis TaxID=1679523 RepID=A0ABR9JQC6_9ACTN|nr:hypothetical protein [Actinomadura algeriensis]MBE1532779.1 hypothetical protein [Actinomadura algeriensis]